jgi:hypothetical protein
MSTLLLDVQYTWHMHRDSLYSVHTAGESNVRLGLNDLLSFPDPLPPPPGNMGDSNYRPGESCSGESKVLRQFPLPCFAHAYCTIAPPYFFTRLDRILI